MVFPLRAVFAALVLSWAFPAAAEPFSFAAIGDAPYTIPGDYQRFAALTARLNAARPAFTVHVGDFKSGSSPCSDQLYEATLELFQAFDGPLVYTPGDNEWTDCHRARAGGFDPLERLAKLRTMFFATPHSFGRASMPVQRQSGDYVENQRWAWGGVMFATLHVVGSNDNLQRDAIAAQEHFQRTEANLAWLRETVGQAGDAAALVLFMQANPGFELKEAEQRSGFSELLTELSHAVAAFGRPVLLVHGDTHYFRVDKPLKDTDGRTVETFTRLEVFGEKDIHGVLVTADPELPEVFSFREMLVR